MLYELTPKQAEYAREAHHRWNFAVGAVRSGKSWMACFYTIPNRLIELHGKKGLNVILGSTRDNIERNVLTPMRDIWGESAVSDINSRNIATIAGEKVLCVGAEKSNQVARLRGSEIKFCYCDEICDIHPQVFDILKSRLSLPYSQCHAACNPEGPRHYVKRFIDSAGDGIDVYEQRYTIHDNPFLPPDYVRAIEAEYAGTVYYDRYIKGLWTQAEGLVYPNYADAFEDAWDGEARDWCVSCDYGTQNPFAALKWALDASGCWHCVGEFYHGGRETGHQMTDADYAAEMEAFCAGLPGPVDFIVDPSATSFIAELRRHGGFRVLKADNAVADGIRNTSVAMQSGRIRIGRCCGALAGELSGYVWDDEEAGDVPVKENDHACDALRYMVRTKRLARPHEEYRSIYG